MGGRTLKVYCAACHHVALLTPEALLRAGLSAAAKVLDLKGRLRCRRCGRKGRAVVSVKWRGRAARSGERLKSAEKERRRVGGLLSTPLPARLGPAGS
jgi:hypothetical protein